MQAISKALQEAGVPCESSLFSVVNALDEIRFGTSMARARQAHNESQYQENVRKEEMKKKRDEKFYWQSPDAMDVSTHNTTYQDAYKKEQKERDARHANLLVQGEDTCKLKIIINRIVSVMRQVKIYKKFLGERDVTLRDRTGNIHVK